MVLKLKSRLFAIIPTVDLIWGVYNRPKKE